MVLELVFLLVLGLVQFLLMLLPVCGFAAKEQQAREPEAEMLPPAAVKTELVYLGNLVGWHGGSAAVLGVAAGLALIVGFVRCDTCEVNNLWEDAIIDSNPALKSRSYLGKNSIPDSRVSTVTPATISFFKVSYRLQGEKLKEGEDIYIYQQGRLEAPFLHGSCMERNYWQKTNLDQILECAKGIRVTNFASCFICNQQGHLSKNCPENKHDIPSKEIPASIILLRERTPIISSDGSILHARQQAFWYGAEWYSGLSIVKSTGSENNGLKQQPLA
ncbi:hypothetical protein ZEAMMB73_Zm00001d002032 [Zea mays]|uniref:CCHC-type domain-containing protein n=1 Tax=Zea mays TaxID=4577 RepID=A0A1D6DVT0_MAIZE|nr:hypothetical protein ZEAMMB73_Zm00001d002032 [Zea mays]ONM12826.1 hypothetical protein ZEAMMB73_Zm00001d002032 [Zea mays]ONM12827.1 hypothetical protein ZEAMMB73_Zm00001d002032 [Zea mays]ONM12840.1 hypothetical protein ZEAMMB73_Zm00001d002032 [Zea mays]ONM12841.1 hypothetical protein ZEAMMB73_Zm00001d002032 [Zea mays]